MDLIVRRRSRLLDTEQYGGVSSHIGQFRIAGNNGGESISNNAGVYFATEFLSKRGDIKMPRKQM